MAVTVGIDLGTTNSLCAYFRDGQPHLIPNVHGRFLTPSVVGVLADGSIVVGEVAKELAVVEPDRCAACFKRYMGLGRTLTLAGKTFTAPELSGLVLRSLRQDAETFLDQPVTSAVITVPAYFNDLQRRATKLAGESAGLEVRRIINEPTAAALVYGFHARQEDKRFCVVDLGGGTFDVTLMEVFEGTLEIIATAGESTLGGEDFTDRLLAAILKREGQSLEVAELKQPLRVARLRHECHRAKCELGEQEEVRVRLPNAAGELSTDAATVKVNLATFSQLVQPLMDRIRRPIDKVLRDSHADPASIAEVILVGGATRMPVLRDYITAYFGQPGEMKYNPDEVVALGAAVQAALLENDVAVSDMVMTDVCPFTLGVEVAKEFGGQTTAGYFQPIIHRNTTIPVSREETFHTICANQPEVLVRVFQGESRRVSENVELGQLRVSGLPPHPAGLAIQIRFTYDPNGILDVEAYVPSSGKKYRTVLTQHVQGLTPEALEQAIERLQSLKFYPRDLEPNRRLVAYCERLVGEIGVSERQMLEQALDVFEESMSSGDPEFFASARAGLVEIVRRLGYEYE